MSENQEHIDQVQHDETTPSEQNYDFSEQVGHLLRRSYQRHTAIFQKLSHDQNLTAIQFIILCTIMDHGASSMVDFVHATAIDPATVRGVINRLKSRDLIVMTLNLQDRRKALIKITGEGERMVSEMLPRAKQISEATMGRLNQPERVALMLLLKKMLGIE